MSAISIGLDAGRLMSAADTDPFRRNYNRLSYVFKHELAGHALFALDSLVAFTRRSENRRHHWSNGPLPTEGQWTDGTIGRQSLQDTIANIEYNNSLVVLRHAEQDSVLGPLLQDALTLMVALCGERLRRDVRVGEALIVVKSPRRIMPYHMDSLSGFVFQVSGTEALHVCEKTGRNRVTNRELEDFFAVDRAVTHRIDGKPDCVTHELVPGDAVHVPIFAPYWTENRDAVSVTLKLNFELNSIERLERLHLVNHRLRGWGLNPAEPNVSPWFDRSKLAAADAVMALRSLTTGPRGAWLTERALADWKGIRRRVVDAAGWLTRRRS
jgi:hypothetical protein